MTNFVKRNYCLLFSEDSLSAEMRRELRQKEFDKQEIMRKDIVIEKVQFFDF